MASLEGDKNPRQSKVTYKNTKGGIKISPSPKCKTCGAEAKHASHGKGFMCSKHYYQDMDKD